MNEDFLGGPPKLFDAVGREQLAVLLDHGLKPASRVLDIGCGPLRAGRWLIPLLDPGCYCGIEPMKNLVESGLERFIPPEIVTAKAPRFDHNDRFDLGVFGSTFTHFLARSIWTHASKEQIAAMLDGVVEHGTKRAVMLTSFLPASKRGEDYAGDGWVGRSHESEEPGVVRHSFGWISAECAARDLSAEIVRRPKIFNGQFWIAIRRASAPRAAGDGGRELAKLYRAAERS